MATIKPGGDDLKGQEVWVKGSEKGEEVGMALSIQLFLFLELTLQCREISPKPRSEAVDGIAGWLGEA